MMRNKSRRRSIISDVAKVLVLIALMYTGIGLWLIQHLLVCSNVSNNIQVGVVASNIYYSPRNDGSPSAVLPPTLPTEICHRLNETNLHRRHAPSPQLANLDKQYALNENVLRTGLVIGGSQGHLQPALLNKIANHEHITVLTLGSSFTRGHGCGETVHQGELDCAWPARFQRWWQTYFIPGVQNSTFVHHAEHGATSVAALQRIGVIIGGMINKPDLIVVDFLVTDATFGTEVATIGYESLLRTILELLPETQLMLLEAGCRKCISNQYVLQRRRQIARQYDIPVIDYAAMVESHNLLHPNDNTSQNLLWPNTEDPKDNKIGTVWPKFIPEVKNTKVTNYPNNHAPWPVHQYISDAFAYALISLLKDQGACNNNHHGVRMYTKHIHDHELAKPFHTMKELNKFQSCKRPLVWHDALAPGNGKNNGIGNPVSKDGNWRLYEDRAGRPGWIATTHGSIITFPLRFSRVRPILAITYLRSYASVGVAYVRLKSHSGNLTYDKLEGHWSQNFSLPDTKVFLDRPGGKDGNMLWYALRSDGYDYDDGMGGDQLNDHMNKTEDYEIDIIFAHGEKFKIIQVISC